MEPIRLIVPPRPADNHRILRPRHAETPDGRATSEGHRSLLGPVIRHTLPERRLAAIGAWCLVEHFGDPETRPERLESPAYPEVGLQSLVWPLDGLIRRRDSAGTDVLIHRGHVALGTAGRGVTVTEMGVDDPRGGRHARRSLHGVRLAAALPSRFRDMDPVFQQVDEPPRVATPTMQATVLVGALAGPHEDRISPAVVHTPLMAADLTLSTGTERLALDPTYEHGILLLDGQVSVGGTPLSRGELGYVPIGRARLDLATLTGCHLLMIGGTPFTEEFILWWNLLAASHDEVVTARASWERQDDRFGTIPGGPPRAGAPQMPPVRLRPRRGSVRHGRPS
ncbi:hypothetical protein KEM60_01402 [Austwickia sp. TVS 96-490-7B]|uniref:pirin family protein n=1 Tax=Austwickia sp. TVS 96-490-7B TaxID=2830843 RepID=UPI001C572F01|nr:pirin-like C-terminal cupin domain-containing protein [Austwickia sp. TVS 96-490-7B]MBW3085205.1 hypothetical protein [Austwickia sp. TVS 96-490-7B]